MRKSLILILVLFSTILFATNTPKKLISKSLLPRIVSSVTYIQKKGNYFVFEEKLKIEIALVDSFLSYKNGKKKITDKVKLIYVKNFSELKKALKKYKNYSPELEEHIKNPYIKSYVFKQGLRNLMALKAFYMYHESGLKKHFEPYDDFLRNITGLEEGFLPLARPKTGRYERMTKNYTKKELLRSKKKYIKLLSYIKIRRKGNEFLYFIPLWVLKIYEKPLIKFNLDLEDGFINSRSVEKYLKIPFSALFRNKKKRVVIWENNKGYKVIE